MTGGGKDGFASSMILAGIVSVDVYGKTPDWMTQRRAGKVKFSDADFIAALAKFADLADKGYIDTSDVSRDYASDRAGVPRRQGRDVPDGQLVRRERRRQAPSGHRGLQLPHRRRQADRTGVHRRRHRSSAPRPSHLDAAKRFALAFQLDKTQLDDSVKSDGLFPAIKGYTPPADIGAVFKAGYDLYQQAVAKNAVVHAFRWETADDGLLPGMADKVDAAAQDLITGRKTPAQAATYLDDEWAKAAAESTAAHATRTGAPTGGSYIKATRRRHRSARAGSGAHTPGSGHPVRACALPGLRRAGRPGLRPGSSWRRSR